MPVIIQPLTTLVPNSEDYGRMAFVGGDLVAILVAVEDGHYARRWSVEWLAPVITASPPTFTRLGAARRWLSSEYRKCAISRH